MLFSDNQTKHFYALKSSNVYTVKNLANSDLVRVMLYESSTTQTAGKAMATTDIIDRKLIKRAKVNEVKPTYFRKWTITAPSTVAAGTTYHLYFYLENMIGFGMQDRWDRVASYTATDTTVATVMQHLAVDLWGKLNAAGPIAGDFTVSYGGTTVTKTMWETNTMPVATSGTNIVVAENPASETFKQLDELDLRMHTNPYAYNVTMSTFDGTSAWGGQKQVNGVEDSTIGTYISAATKVLAMELYFLRNRADKYDLTKDFYASILNKTNTDKTATSYYTVDIDYAFSDTQGYTYHSDKQLSIAVPGASSGTASTPADTLLAAIVGDTVATNTAAIDALDTRVTTLEEA